jgi:hypothetical protein
MAERQLDLFSQRGESVQPTVPAGTARRHATVSQMSDSELIGAIAEASLADCLPLTDEAARRKLTTAVPALATLCRRFGGFGADRRVPEQVAAIEALARIGGSDAADAVADIIGRAIIQGPGLAIAVRAAARLRAPLPVAIVQSLLRHPEAQIRADACRCVQPSTELVSMLVDLLRDIDPAVERSAACALGRMGRIEALPVLKELLDGHPPDEVIDAVSSIADEDCVVRLGQIARRLPSLAAAALEALEGSDHPRAGAIAAAVRGLVRR